MMESILTLEEISALVRTIPPEKWQYSQPNYNEQLTFRVADLELVLINYPLAQIENVSLTLRYVQDINYGSIKIAEYDKIPETIQLFRETIRRVSTYHNERNAIEVSEALSNLRIEKNLAEKIASVRVYVI